ncbi:MAG TPA: PAS domain-containing sensor histidine kinase [candidate division WOR-3 bacterium]|uniref:histidine kinase n=1 Tax=candidate division WOR-3 bacterium TaxID=2052148 RepID=A0A7V0T4G0_UNCW3|nr:PAS domain-containing sensor histidine kinase [candidate division WOR-3 bacterium]
MDHSNVETILSSREFLDVLQEGVWVSDGDARIVLANTTLATLLGYRSPDALVGRDWHDLFPAGEGARLSRHRRGADASAGRDSESREGAPAGSVGVMDQTSVVTRDGEQLPVKARLVRRTTGGTDGYIGTVLPSDRGVPGSALADATSRQVMENSIDGICIIRDGKISYVNRRFEKLTGYSLQQMAQIGLERLVVPSDRERIARSVADPSRMLAPVHHTVRLITRSAHEIDCELRIVTAETNSHAVLVCFLRDVSELTRARQARTDFVAVVSHELRTPLAAIKEAVSLVADSPELRTQGDLHAGERPRRYLDIAQEEIARLNRMISNLLEVARVESGKSQLVLGPVDLRSCIIRTVESMTTLLNKKRLKAELLIPEDLPPVLGDEDRLRLVFNNLLDNAVKYTPTGSAVRISARLLDPGAPVMSEENLLPDTSYVQVSVADSGPGIPAEFLERVFGRYERVDPHGPGIGLGLAIARSIIETHHGKIWVRSELGEGTCFNLILPVREAH